MTYLQTQELEPNVAELSSSGTFPAGDSPTRSGEWVSTILIKVSPVDVFTETAM